MDKSRVVLEVEDRVVLEVEDEPGLRKAILYDTSACEEEICFNTLELSYFIKHTDIDGNGYWQVVQENAIGINPGLRMLLEALLRSSTLIPQKEGPSSKTA